MVEQHGLSRMIEYRQRRSEIRQGGTEIDVRDRMLPRGFEGERSRQLQTDGEGLEGLPGERLRGAMSTEQRSNAARFT